MQALPKHHAMIVTLQCFIDAELGSKDLMREIMPAYQHSLE